MESGTEEKPVIVTCVKNPFDPLGSRETRTFAPGLSVRQCVDEFYPGMVTDYEIKLSINGCLADMEKSLDLVCSPGLSLVFCAVPRGGGDLLRTVAMLAVIVAAVLAPQLMAAYPAFFEAALPGALLDYGGTILSGMTLMAGSMVVNAVLPPQVPDIASANLGTNDMSNSATYGWDVQKNPDQEGGASPGLYGTRRVTPPRIARYIEIIGDKQYLNMLFKVADHALDSISDVEINDNPVMNFRDVITETRLGGIDQSPIQFFHDQRQDVSCYAQLSADWVTRQTSGNAVQGIGVALICPKGLYYSNDQGGLSEISVDVEIEYRRIGDSAWTRLSGYNTYPITVDEYRWSAGVWKTDTGQWMEVYAGSTNYADHQEGDYINPPYWDDFCGGWQYSGYRWHWVTVPLIYAIGTVALDYVQISGAQTSPLRRMWFQNNLPPGQYEVRARFHSAPPAGVRYVNDCYFDFIQEIIYDDFSFPGQSLLAVRALATDQLYSDVNKVTCLAMRSTVEVWNGTDYDSLPANLPPWACYDMLHNDDYGGQVNYNRIPLARWQEWADWCVLRGYECNIYFDTIFNLKKALDTVSVAGRGTVIQMGSRFTCIVDKPEALPVQRFLFTPGNIVKDSFNVDYVQYEDRADAIEITYWDEDLNYEQQIVTVTSEFYESIDREIKPTQMTLYSVTNRQQAINYGKFLLNCNRWLSLIAGWDADIDSLGCLSGDVVEIGWDYGGRTMEATSTTIRCDRDITLDPVKSYAITIKYQDDDSREDRTVTGVAADPDWESGNTYDIGDYAAYAGKNYRCIQAILETPSPAPTDGRHWRAAGTNLNVTPAWTKTPAQFAIYSFGEEDMVTKLVRVISIGRSQKMRRRVSALEYVAEVYDDIADIPAPSPITNPGISNMRIIEKWDLGRDGTGQSILYLTWRGADLAWDVYCCTTTSGWVNKGFTRIPSFSIPGLIAGLTYTISIVRRGESAENGFMSQFTPQGKDIPPEDVVNFNAQARPDGRIGFTWDHVSDMDLWGYDIRQGSFWETATPKKEGVWENSATYDPGIAGTYHFLIKAIDRSGNCSQNATGVTITTNVTNLNVVIDEDEITSHAGTFDKTIYCPTPGVMALIAGMTDTDEPTFTDQTPGLAEYAGEQDYIGSYISPVYDLGAKVVFSLRANAAYGSVVREANDQTFPNRTDQTYPLDTDTHITSSATQKIYAAFSDDDIDWSAWQEIRGALQAEAQYFKIKVECLVDTANTNFEWTALAHQADVPDKKLRLLNQAIGIGGTTFTLASLGLTILKEYFIGVTVLGAASVWPVVNKSDSEFTVHFFNSSGAVAGSGDLDIGGY